MSNRVTVEVTFEDGNSLVSTINLSFEEAKAYYMNNTFNLGREEDKMVKAVKVEQV